MILALFLCGLQAEPTDAARSHWDAHAPGILAEYRELLEMPCVASDLPNIRRNAVWIRDALARRGVQAKLFELDGVPPIVYGRLDAPGAQRTLGIYVHYDGQPVDESQWVQSPWEPTLYDRALAEGGAPIAWPEDGEEIDPEWRIYARAAGDDKAPIPAILAALDALDAAGIERQSNLMFFFEGEEEAGSGHLGEYMDRHAQELQCDLWLVCDGPVHQSRRAQLVFGVRGYASLELTVYGANRYLHSGHYGNWAPNPGLRLARLLASMKDPDGRVTVDGFYDTVRSTEAAVREATATIPPFEDALRREFGLAESEARNASYLERILLPSLNVRGLASATVGATARNVIPPTATAAIDVRLAAGNEPEAMLDLVEAHVRAQGYHVVHREPTAEERLEHPLIAKILRGSANYRGVRTSMDLPMTRWLREQAARAEGDALVLMPTLGGSLPLYLFEEKLGAPMVVVPIANHDNNQHAPNENLRLANLEYGIRLYAQLFAAN